MASHGIRLLWLLGLHSVTGLAALAGRAAPAQLYGPPHPGFNLIWKGTLFAVNKLAEDTVSAHEQVSRAISILHRLTLADLRAIMPSCGHLARPCVLTLDAFGTLFHPRQPIGQQYAETAKKHGLLGFTDEEVASSFRTGKKILIRQTFLPVARHPIAWPDELIPDLLHRFSSEQGYQLYPDVVPLFQRLKQLRKDGFRHDVKDPSLQVGIVTNSDDRVPSILSSLGLHVMARRLDNPHALAGWTLLDNNADIHWVLMSYDAGFAKPDFRIFDCAKKQTLGNENEDCVYLHVGDDFNQDYHAATRAGWQSLFLDRDHRYTQMERASDRIESLVSLDQKILELCSA
ncbi:MAG: hypothetical protein Q9167_006948 [Letrouitia subvulpina]